jgi:nicotinamide mononucleotide transporter
VLHELIDPLNHVLFVFGTDYVTWAEIMGFITGLWTVWLTVRERVSLFPIGIANNVFFFLLFINAKLYADAYLQLVYVALAAWGWWVWVRHPKGQADQITFASEMWMANTFIGVAVAFVILYPILRSANDIAPFWDALTTALSLGAQFLLNFKKIQNWYLWIAADLIYIPLYFTKNLYLTGIVYICFLAMCFAGVYQWVQRRELSESYG